MLHESLSLDYPIDINDRVGGWNIQKDMARRLRILDIVTISGDLYTLAKKCLMDQEITCLLG